MYDIKLWERAKCPEDERKKIIPLIEKIVTLAEKSMKDGLLSIGNELPGIDMLFLGRGLQFVVDGTDPALVREILLTWIYADGHSGAELLGRMAAADGILQIQQGTIIHTLRNKLYAYLGENMMPVKDVSASILRQPGSGSGGKGETADKKTYVTESPAGKYKTRTIIDAGCRDELAGIMVRNNRIISQEPVSAEEIAALSEVINSSAEGIETFIDILKSQPGIVSGRLLEGFDAHNKDLYGIIRGKWFIFEDMVNFDNLSIQKTLRETDSNMLAIALKAASPELQQRIFSNMSERAASLLKEDMDYMGPVKLEDVLESQGIIVRAAQRLADAGEIRILKPGEKTV